MIVKTFILENWRLIVDILSVICVTIFFFIKKKPVKVVNSITDFIYFVLPSVIQRAEKLYPGDGKSKRNFVINVIVDYIHDRWPDVDAGDYYDFISLRLEDILSTPQKKGVLKDE